MWSHFKGFCLKSEATNVQKIKLKNTVANHQACHRSQIRDINFSYQLVLVK